MMEKRNWAKLGIETSLLGFGCMRFPKLENGQIDEEHATQMLEMAYEAGVNYYDTAYMYHDGASESFLGQWLDTKPRDSYFLTTKLPVMMIESLEDAKRIYQEQKQRLHKDYFDFYLLHSLNKDTFERAKKLGLIEFCEELLQKGEIRHFGFSFHDDYEVFEEILRYRDWDMCQIQYNYTDREIQAGDRGYALAEELGIPMVIMEPVKGGSLAQFPDEVVEPFTAIDPKASIASWAYRWVGGHQNVHVVLSGMSSIEQARDNIATFTHFRALDEREEKAVEEVTQRIRARVNNGCTGCRYCMPCPAGVNIPRNFQLWNDYAMYRHPDSLEFAWLKDLPESEKAKNCIKCGKCERVCPQKLHIREDLATLQKELDGLFGIE